MDELEYDSSDDDSQFIVVFENRAGDTDMEVIHMPGDERDLSCRLLSSLSGLN